jgi:hypothetical protein
MRTAALLTALLLVLAGVTPAGAFAASEAAPDADDSAVAPKPLADAQIGTQTRQMDSPQTVMTVSLRGDRSARWHVEMRFRLESANETRAFERIGREYENGEADVGVNAKLFENIAARASERTGRSMEIQNESYGYSVENGTGTLSLTFVWTNFLNRTDTGDLSLGDAFLLPTEEAQTSQTWLSLAGANQRLVIQPPPGYTTNTTSIRVKQQNNAIIVEGPGKFEGEDTLVVTYRRTEEEAQTPWGLIVGGGIAGLLVLLLAVAVVFRRDESSAPAGSGAGTTTDAGGGGAATTNGGHSPPDGAPQTVGDEPTDDPDEGGEDEPEVDLSLLSDEERVEYLLEQNGGRMKQASIVKETGWSDAKVSQLLSAMADEGRVDKLRLGRENLISLPDGDEDEAEDLGDPDR